MTTLVLLGDTHMPRFGRGLPGPLLEGLRDADLILHAGDITEHFVLDQLAEHAPVFAVAGNNDSPELTGELGLTRIFAVDDVRFGLTHGHLGPGKTTPERAARAFAGEHPRLDAICFGHSHIPMIEHADGQWLLNPGSPTDRRRQKEFSYMRIEVDGGQIRPRLVTYGSWR
jgi:putative phosphoesterase